MATPTVLIRFHYYKPDSSKRSSYGSANKENDYLNYVDTGVKSGKYQDYMDYSGNKEKSSGVFNQNGLLSEKEKKEVRETLRNSQGVIWDGVISFEEKYGKEKLKNWKDAQKLLVNTLPSFLRANNMTLENTLWFAGLHENTDNRHIHLLLNELKPIHINPDTKKTSYHNGLLKQISIDDMKVRVQNTESPECLQRHRQGTRVL